MRKLKFTILVAVALGIQLCCPLVSAQGRGETYQVDIIHNEQGWHIEPCPLPGFEGDSWRIRNLSSDTVCVQILIMVGDKNPFGYTLAPMDSVDHPVSMWDCGIEVFLDVCPGGLFLTECRHPCGNALTRWGLIVLVVLLISVTIWILLRKKAGYATSR